MLVAMVTCGSMLVAMVTCGSILVAMVTYSVVAGWFPSYHLSPDQNQQVPAVVPACSIPVS